MPDVLEPDLLRTFLAIADSGSFTEAARRVFRTQSAVSMQMKRLEEVLGRPLFGRNGRSVQLTPDGELLLGHARRILRAHQQALAAFDDSELQGNVVIGSPDDYASAFLPGVLVRFAETHPRVHVELVCIPTIDLLPRLEDGSVDLALITMDHGDNSGLVLHREPLVWLTSARHCVHEQNPLPLALFHTGCIFRRWALEALGKQGRASRIAYTSVSAAGLKAALDAGLAVGVMGRSGVTEGLRMLGEKEGFPPLPHFEIALKRARDKPSALLDALEAHLIDHFHGPLPLAVGA